MEIQLFSGATFLGIVDSKIIDESMGVVGGLLEPSNAYYNDFQLFFRAHTESADWNKLAQLELKATLASGEVLNCGGGICVTDVEMFPEVSIEFCGLDLHIMDLFRKKDGLEPRYP